MTNSYAIATVKPWNVEIFQRRVDALPGQWHLIDDKAQLTIKRLRDIDPRYVFFPHWSWRVPDAILSEFECVCFHMTDVPYGRGGSPLQNLIWRGHIETKVSALRMMSEMDAGPVYMKRPLSLDGRAEAIYRRLAEVVFDMMDEIVATEPTPVPQHGEPVVFPRRKPADSELPRVGDGRALYDHIRMLDAPTYPLAFVDWGHFRLEFAEAELQNDGSVSARVSIRCREDK
jgi:methionyl-tRNA formyltransferase